MNAAASFSLRLALLAALPFAVALDATAQSPPQTPMTRLRPIGSPSAVDRYPQAASRRETAGRERQYNRRETAHQSSPQRQAWSEHRSSPDRQHFRPASSTRVTRSGARVTRSGARVTRSGARVTRSGVRQAVFQQSDRDPVTAPQLPGSGMSYPGPAPPSDGSLPSSSGTSPAPRPMDPSASSPNLPSPGAAAGDPPSLAPRAVSPGTVGPGISGSGDLTPLPQPQLEGSGFATIDNCSCISAPSSYSAASGIDCGAPPAYAPPPARIPEPAIMPPATPLAAAPTGAPARSLFTLGQERYPVEVGQGLWGQPVAYVPGQHMRNWIRYMSP